MPVPASETRRPLPGWLWAALLLPFLAGGVWFLRGPAPLDSAGPLAPSGPSATPPPGPLGPASASSQGSPPVPPHRPGSVLVLGRLVEPGGFVPHRSLLYATRIFAAGAPKAGLVPTEDGGFSFYASDPAVPIALEIRTGFHAVLGSRVLVDESAARRTDPAAAGDRRSMDLGEIVLPSPERLASLSGVVQSAGGGAVEAVGVRLSGLEEIEGQRLEAVDNRHAIGHPPNVPARYVRDGRFLVRHIPPGGYELEVRGRGHRTFRKKVEIVAGGALPPMTVTLDAAPMVEGSVTDASNGQAVSRSEIGLWAGPRKVGEAVSDEQGRYRVTLEEEVQDGEIRLCVTRRGYEKTEVLLPVRRLSLARPLDQPVVLKAEPDE